MLLCECKVGIGMYINSRDGTKPLQSTRSIEYRINFKVSVSPKKPIPIPCTFRSNKKNNTKLLFKNKLYIIKLLLEMGNLPVYFYHTAKQGCPLNIPTDDDM